MYVFTVNMYLQHLRHRSTIVSDMYIGICIKLGLQALRLLIQRVRKETLIPLWALLLNGKNSHTMSFDSLDTSKIDEHECKLEQIGREKGPETKYQCTICGTVTRPAQGVRKAKRNRRW